jgi:hypothetical protein
MITLPRHLFDQLLANGEASARAEIDPVPVVKFFDPCGAATWLLTEVDPQDHDRLFGLCDLGMGYPELGYVLFSELAAVKGRLNIGLERDFFFVGRYPLSVYARAAQSAGRIVEDDSLLARAAEALAASPSPDTRISPPDSEAGDG